jgi:hypothetical protein
MTPKNTVIQSALKQVHQKLPLATGNLGLEIARSWQYCRNLSVHPIRPFPRACIWRCNCLALSFCTAQGGRDHSCPFLHASEVA